MTIDEVCKELKTNLNHGLSSSEVQNRFLRDGPNILTPVKEWNQFMKFIFSLFRGFGPIMWISFILMFLTYIPLGGPNPNIYNLAVALAIFVVIIAQGGFAWYQEYENSNVLASFSNLVPLETIVIRDGQVSTILASNLVVGDIIVLSIGDILPADIRVIESHGLKADTSALTGESHPLDINTEPVDTPLLNATNCLFLGTSVIFGKGKGIVVSTGDRCIMAKILKTNTGGQEITTLDYEVNLFVAVIAVLAITVGISVYLVWEIYVRVYHTGFISQADVITNCISILLGVVPTGMPVAVSASLTLIARRLCQEYKVLVSKMGTVETLGCISIIASDKTGTLTTNEMTVVSVIIADKCYTNKNNFEEIINSEPTHRLTRSVSLCNSSSFSAYSEQGKSPEYKVIGGNGVDAGTLRWAALLDNVLDIRTDNKILAEYPFNSVVKFAARIYTSTKTYQPILILIGSPEGIMDGCSDYYEINDKKNILNDFVRSRFSELMDECATQGQRVVAVAEEILDTKLIFDDGSFDWHPFLQNRQKTLIGLLALQDPPRPEVKDVIKQCKASHVRVMMVTGDHPTTALSIARQVGIITCPEVSYHYNYRTRNRAYTIEMERVLRRKSIIQLFKSLIQNEEDEEEEGPDLRTVYRKEALVLTGLDIAEFTFSHWNWVVQHEEVIFARTTPDQKLKIVTEFQRRGHTVAVTGDGINDAAALRRADCGICMQSGADVAREAADIVLMTNNFNAVLEGIREGRLLFTNLKRVINYLLPAGSYAETMPAVVNICLGIPLPLSTFQVLAVCIGTDIFGSTSLIYTKAESDIMNYPPRNVKTDRLVDRKIFSYAYMFVGNYYILAAFTNFFYYWSTKGIHMSKLFFAWNWGNEGYLGLTLDEQSDFLATSQSIYFMTLVVCQLGNLISLQTRNLPFGVMINGKRKWPILEQAHIIAFFLELIVLIFLLYTPFCNSIFDTRPVGGRHWGIAFAFSFGLILLAELKKWCCYLYPGCLIDKYFSW
mmetsp:Transcript_5567/g.5726  ORF Transcript_5567/g.5726 Transcript_5567/m.5726 type:complete len:1006 (+) Transcript_5567:257-3274(+)